jgi:hypothetical protein
MMTDSMMTDPMTTGRVYHVVPCAFASTTRAWGDPRWQSRGICIASLASQEEEGVEVLKKTPRKGKDLSRGQGDERTLEKRMLLI